MIELPTVKHSKWRFRSWVADLINAMCAFALALFTGIRLIRDPGASFAEIAGVFFASSFILIASTIKAYRTRASEMKYEPLEEPEMLVGWAKGLHGNLCTAVAVEAESLGVRI